jgi:hypothetical protein
LSLARGTFECPNYLNSCFTFPFISNCTSQRLGEALSVGIDANLMNLIEISQSNVFDLTYNILESRTPINRFLNSVGF